MTQVHSDEDIQHETTPTSPAARSVAALLSRAINSYGPTASTAYQEAEKLTREAEAARNAEIVRISCESENLREYVRIFNHVEEAKQTLEDCKQKFAGYTAAAIDQAYNGFVAHCLDSDIDPQWVGQNVFERIAATAVVEKHLPVMLKRLEAELLDGPRKTLAEFISAHAELLKKHGFI